MLTKEEVLHIAQLARIELDDTEVSHYQKELSAILDYIQKLEHLPTDGVEPIGHITGMVNIYRQDKERIRDDEERKAIMENIPHKKKDYVCVKKVLQ